MEIRIAGTVNDSITDGPGLRYTVFAQGCRHKCPGCHNPQTHDENGGRLIGIDALIAEAVKNPLLDGVTISGGEPFLQRDALRFLVGRLAEREIDVMVYTGHTWEELILNPENMNILEKIDYLVDGKFVQSKKSLDLVFRGSSNQRIINVKKSLAEGKLYITESFE
ncbi:MAG: anaerobic ribonucleoside-triphosphate reductase activating protein [Defluviitaleaceae bacterium]|nr:anaerobic ribonucleoside-triphosphate reductase activating protein [Defluviitaleaceae bacterium]